MGSPFSHVVKKRGKEAESDDDKDDENEDEDEDEDEEEEEEDGEFVVEKVVDLKMKKVCNASVSVSVC
jgi:hypothetical protein